jgi:hypothetical protein
VINAGLHNNKGFDDMSAVLGGPDGNARDSEGSRVDRFTEHCEKMRFFLQYHTAWRTVWPPPIDEMLPYDIRHGLVETGGVFDAIDGSDWVLLLPLRRVTRRHVVLN